MSPSQSPQRHLHEIEPREQSGARTGERFEFQYIQAASDSLRVLDDTEVACVFCEWHDDYVVELAGEDALHFHQVKSRSASRGPWKSNEFFGTEGRRWSRIPRDPASRPANPDSIFARFYDHVDKFGERCDRFVFVTDSEPHADLSALLRLAAEADDLSKLTGPDAPEFHRLHRALAQTFQSLSADAFLAFLRKLQFQSAIGRLGALSDCRVLIGSRIQDISEVQLSITEARRIADELIAEVRTRSHLTLASLPPTLKDLRSLKGLVLGDVLRVLSLSAAGYRELRSSGRQAVIFLSRLQRFLRRNDVDESLTSDLCRLKSQWDSYWAENQQLVDGLDFIAIRQDCATALQLHSAGRLDFRGLRDEARQLRTRYGTAFAAARALGDEEVFGLMMSMAAEAE